MSNMINRIINYLKDNYNRRTFIFSFISALICVAYAIYNGVLGLLEESIWNGSICIYYILLIVVKSFLLINRNGKENSIFVIAVSFPILLIITPAMITPAILLINDRRTYDFGLIPAITMAAYTTYSITLAIINLRKAANNDCIIVKQLRLINMISALMSLIVLQNTMINANGGYDEEMTLLTSCTSIGIILVVIILIVRSFVKSIKSFQIKSNNDN